MSTAAPKVSTLPPEHRERLMAFAEDVYFESGHRLFEEQDRADRFWIVKTGAVTLDAKVPGRGSPVIETLRHGELVGLSWMFPPYLCQSGAEAMTPVRAYEFDGTAVRSMCRTDESFGYSVTYWVGRILAHRLQVTRVRLLDLYAPHGSGILA
ncbi:Crp/Fnr family transcriptional regulator [Streptomyces roseicoloratus]|uniref:Cyclic nucleotide-binding domain-containing protein n=1 Tax=Streptomyces roseicoloratus TaxID=2508722 RepID=A0ABY9RQ87_9ACTN|nr:cyclic nucleotide-binding domain-containing protein [Streptomyces roseicoloratus]WMX43858.1 cyclic nucleotide-binding domain-containing protein [Streptomyces roseicoloratus]